MRFYDASNFNWIQIGLSSSTLAGLRLQHGRSNDYHVAAQLSPAPRIIARTFEWNQITQQKSHIECILLSASNSFSRCLQRWHLAACLPRRRPSSLWCRSSRRFCFYLSGRGWRCAGCGTASHLAAQSHDTPHAWLLQSPAHHYGNGSMAEERWQYADDLD